MAVEALLKPSEQAWEGTLTNLVQRFAQLDSSVVLDTLRQNDGHGGNTAKALRKLAPGAQAVTPAPAAVKAEPVKVAPKKESPPQATKAVPVAVAPKKELPKNQPTPAKATAPAAKTAPPPAVAAAEAPPPVDDKLLFVAALQGDIQQLNQLVTARADLNGRYTGRPASKADKIIDATPLHLVVTMGRADVAEALLKHGADVEAKMCRALGAGKPPDEQYAEMTPLHLAAMEGHTNIVEMLIGYGANKSARMQLAELKDGDQHKRAITPLEIAHEMVAKGHPRESVISLLTK